MQYYYRSFVKKFVISFNYAPVNVKPHLPQVGQQMGVSRGLSRKIVPRVGAFAKA